MVRRYVQNYVKDLIELENELDIEAMGNIIQSFEAARQSGDRIFIFGNGGSAAHANHFAGDLSKNVTRREKGRFHILSLCENMTVITAYANDIGYESVFCEQLKNYRLKEGDLVFAISSSGNSPNVVQACEYAGERGAKILSLTGFSGGKLKEMSDISLHIKCNEYEKVEDLHMAALHMIVSYFKNQEAGAWA